MSRPRVARFLVFRIIIFALLSSLTLISAQEERPQFGGTLRVRTFSPALMPSLDPASADPDASIIILDQIFEGLVRFDPNLQVVPELAEYWTISQDGTKYTFYLRKDVRFHHGRSFRAEDVKFSLERLLQPGASGGFHQYFVSRVVGAEEFHEGKASEVTGFVVRDAHTFEIQLIRPYISLLSVLGAPFCKILPRELLLSQGKKFFLKPSGTGPFKFAYWLRDSRLDVVGVRLERNENFYGRKPYLEAIEFSPNFTLDQFLEEEIDIMPYYSRSLSRTECQVLESDSFHLLYLGFSCHLQPLDDPRVRRAIALALDKRDLARAYFTFESMPQVLNNIVHPRLPGFFPLQVEEERDVGRALSLLEEAGFSTWQSLPPLDFCVLKADRWRAERLYRRLKEQLNELGINLRWKLISKYDALHSLKSPYLVLFSWRMDFPDPENIIRPLFSSASELNRSVFHYDSDRLESLLGRTDIEKSWTRRNELFREMEKVLLEEVPVIPLFLLNQRLAVQRYVHGLKVPGLGFSFLDMSRVWRGGKR